MDSNTIVETYLIENGFEDLKDYEGIYKINKEGKIWSVKRKIELKYTNEKGIDRIGLFANGKQKQYKKAELLDIQYNNKINTFIHQPDLTDFEDLKNYEGLYKINKEGEIWSCFYNKFMIALNDEGYLKIQLRKNTKSFHTSIHRLLAIQYIPNPENLLEIDHIDRNRSNNNLENLRWADKFIQNNNKSNCDIFKTEEEIIKKVENLKEYKRQWAENDRRAKGIPEKKIGFDNYAYQKEWRKQKMEKMTPEEKEKLLEHNRERYSKREITEEQRERAKERARKQREEINADPEKLAQLKEYKKQKAKEYREKKEQEK